MELVKGMKKFKMGGVGSVCVVGLVEEAGEFYFVGDLRRQEF